MPLHPLTPKITKYELGTLRLWQDELAEIVRSVQQLPDVQVRIEADNNLLDDVSTDLPSIGQRVRYFSVTATSPNESDGRGREVICVQLTAQHCRIEASDPDLATMGLIESLRSLLGNCRRMAPWLQKFFEVPADPLNRPASSTLPFAALIVLASLVFGAIFGVGTVQHFVHAHGKPLTPWPASVIVSAVALIVASALILGLTKSRTLMLTATRSQAPTFWQRKRSDIAIHLIVGAIFFLLGLLVGHHL